MAEKFKPRHLVTGVTDKDGNVTKVHSIQVGRSSFIHDPNPPDSGHCEHCGVAIPGWDELVARLAAAEEALREFEEDAGTEEELEQGELDFLDEG